MRYRIGLHPYSISEFGPVHTLDTNVRGDGRYRIHAIFSDGHPHNSLHYLRYENSGLSRGGRAWPHDIALDTNGRPRVVYTRRVGGDDSSGTRTTTASAGSAARSSTRAGRAGRSPPTRAASRCAR